jgi:hypothetical protein
MVNPVDEMGVRGSICWSVFIEGAGAAEGVRLPWASRETGRVQRRRAMSGVEMIFIDFELSKTGLLKLVYFPGIPAEEGDCEEGDRKGAHMVFECHARQAGPLFVSCYSDDPMFKKDTSQTLAAQDLIYPMDVRRMSILPFVG